MQSKAGEILVLRASGGRVLIYLSFQSPTDAAVGGRRGEGGGVGGLVVNPPTNQTLCRWGGLRHDTHVIALKMVMISVKTDARRKNTDDD